MTRLWIEGVGVTIPEGWDCFVFQGQRYRKFHGKFHAVNA